MSHFCSISISTPLVCSPKDTKKRINGQNKKKLCFLCVSPLCLSVCWGFLTADSRSISTPVFNLLVCNLWTCQFLYLLPNCSTCLVLLPVPKVELAGCFITCVCFVYHKYYAKKTTELISVGRSGNGTRENPLNLAIYLNKGLCARIFSISFNIPR